jgi:hypothetical protein
MMVYMTDEKVFCYQSQKHESKLLSFYVKIGEYDILLPVRESAWDYGAKWNSAWDS